jgi:hypothetical protein
MWIGLRPETTHWRSSPRPQLFEPPFNACELASVKVMLEHTDEGLDIAADAAELADRSRRGRLVLWPRFETLQRFTGAGERRGDLIGVGGNPQAPLAVEGGERAEPAVHGLGETEARRPASRGRSAEPTRIGVAMEAGITGALAVPASGCGLP